MESKKSKTAIVFFLTGGLVFFYWLMLLVLWNPADASMKFAMTISSDDSEVKPLRSFFSGRINKNLSDADFELLHDNFSEEETWQEFFGKVPERKFNLLPIREMAELGLEGVKINLLLVPSITGWKIDGLKSVRKNQEEGLK